MCLYVHMYDLFYVCLDNSEEVYKIALPEKSELEELTHSGELQMTNYIITISYFIIL